MLKEKLGIVLTISILMGTMISICEAGNNIWRDVGKVLSSMNTDSSHNSGKSFRQRIDYAPQQIEFNLDGSYSRIQFPSSMFPKSACVSEHHFTVDKPSEIGIHFIGHTRRYFTFRVYDADQNELGSRASVLENATDKTMILKPGRYVIKTTIDGNNGQNKKDIDFEIKGTIHNIPVTVTEANYTRHNAAGLFFGKEVVDYMPVYNNNEKDLKYYKIMLQAPTNINILIDQLSKRCDVYFTLLDEDERVIGYLDGFSDNRIIYKTTLDAGVYYLRAKRSGGNSEKDSAYSICIK